jgi:hypothetical protein
MEILSFSGEMREGRDILDTTLSKKEQKRLHEHARYA